MHWTLLNSTTSLLYKCRPFPLLLEQTPFNPAALLAILFGCNLGSAVVEGVFVSTLLACSEVHSTASSWPHDAAISPVALDRVGDISIYSSSTAAQFSRNEWSKTRNQFEHTMTLPITTLIVFLLELSRNVNSPCQHQKLSSNVGQEYIITEHLLWAWVMNFIFLLSLNCNIFLLY